jgi:hypothetical protein
MTARDAERLLELEESAEGVELFRSPGSELQVEKARDQAEASGWIPEREVAGVPTRRGTIWERREMLREAMDRLEMAISGPSGADGWFESVGDRLGAVGDGLAMHFKVTEGPDGLLEEIMTRSPRLSNEVGEVGAEHAALRRALDGAMKQVRRGVDARAVRRKTMTLLARIADHRQRGADLVYEAFNVDLGAGD